MKKLIIGLLLLGSFSSFASEQSCNVFVDISKSTDALGSFTREHLESKGASFGSSQ